jgi:hypothetical protein
MNNYARQYDQTKRISMASPNGLRMTERLSGKPTMFETPVLNRTQKKFIKDL